jgi:hypothetical protein
MVATKLGIGEVNGKETKQIHQQIKKMQYRSTD